MGKSTSTPRRSRTSTVAFPVSGKSVSLKQVIKSATRTARVPRLLRVQEPMIDHSRSPWPDLVRFDLRSLCLPCSAQARSCSLVAASIYSPRLHRTRLSAPLQPHSQEISATRRSLTLVPVGPVTSRAPPASSAAYESLSDSARWPNGVAARQHLPDDRRVHRGSPEGVARESGGEKQRRVPKLPCLFRRGLGCVPAAAADTVHDFLEDGVVRCRGLLSVLQVIRDAIRWFYAVELQHAPGVLEGSGVGSCQATGDGRRLVAHHIREQEGYGRGRMGQPHQAAALQHGDVLPYGVDLPYIRPALEEVGRKLLQVCKLDRRSWVGEQRRGPA